MEQLINKNTESPNISLGAIDIVNESLRRHVYGRTDVDILELIPK
jgi:hypothetical protein